TRERSWLRLLVPFTIELLPVPVTVPVMPTWSNPFGLLGTPLVNHDDRGADRAHRLRRRLDVDDRLRRFPRPAFTRHAADDGGNQESSGGPQHHGKRFLRRTEPSADVAAVERKMH